MTQLILIPGLASDHVMWQAQLAALPGRYRAHVSDVASRRDSIEAMAATLLTEHPGELILCGASMGGIIAMQAAHQGGERIRGLALLGTNARPETDDVRAMRELAITLFANGRAAEVLRANVPLAFHASRSRDTTLVQRYIDFVLKAGAEQLIRQNRAIMARPDARPTLPGVACPALVMWGDSDQLTPPEANREIAALLPRAQAVELAQCGHMLTMEQPEQVNAHLLRWLEDLNGQE
ncbi:MAG: alpha/beta fold hydrolase [Burkholderiaceae bacterium]